MAVHCGTRYSKVGTGRRGGIATAGARNWSNPAGQIVHVDQHPIQRDGRITDGSNLSSLRSPLSTNMIHMNPIDSHTVTPITSPSKNQNVVPLPQDEGTSQEQMKSAESACKRDGSRT